jgi:glycosyltransferase involved in cell wall biosynthesis
MRIGLDGIPLASRKTGIGHYTLELARALAKLAPHDQFELLSPVRFISSLEHSPTNLRQVEAARRKFWFIVGLPLYIRRNSLALFHGTNYEVPWWNECPAILSIHDLSLLLHSETHQSHLVRRARYRLPLMARWATKIITASEFMKKEVSEHLKIDAEKIAVTPYAPRHNFRPLERSDTEQTRLRLGVEDVFILFVGTIEPRKNLITLLRAFSEILKNTDLRPQLVIAGQEGWLVGETLNYVHSEGLSERIKFTGYITDAELRALYSSCAVFVYPSLYEGFGLPPLEAMACGAPVITSDVPSLRETVGEAALLVAPTDAQKLAGGIVDMLRDEEQKTYFSQVGLERASQFTWERTAHLTMEVYREVTLKEFPRKGAKAQRKI